MLLCPRVVEAAVCVGCTVDVVGLPWGLAYGVEALRNRA